MLTEKIPAQSIEHEQSLLAQCLVFGAQAVTEALVPGDFYRIAHQVIFAAISEMTQRNEPIDIITLVETLRKNDELEKIGGASYLAQLMDIPVPSSVSGYIKTVKEKSILRKLMEKTMRIAQQCMDPKSDAQDVLDAAQREIIGIEYDLGEGDAIKAAEALNQIIDDIERHDFGELSGMSTGFRKLDNILGGMQNSDSILLGGRPSMGKTAFGLNVVRNVAIGQGIPCGIISLEMSSKQLTRRLVSMIGNINSGKFLRYDFVQADWEKVYKAAEKIQTAPIYIDDRSALTYQQVRRSLRSMQKKHGIRFAVIDYLQLMNGDKDHGRYAEVGSISRAVKAMAKEFDMPILVLCQLNRKLEERSNKRPILSDLRDSGELEQDADIVMFIYRDEVYNEDENNPNRGMAEIIVRKHREGAVGMAPVAFQKQYQRFTDLAVDSNS